MPQSGRSATDASRQRMIDFDSIGLCLNFCDGSEACEEREQFPLDPSTATSIYFAILARNLERYTCMCLPFNRFAVCRIPSYLALIPFWILFFSGIWHQGQAMVCAELVRAVATMTCKWSGQRLCSSNLESTPSVGESMLQYVGPP